jgi:hypothetical protein
MNRMTARAPSMNVRTVTLDDILPRAGATQLFIPFPWTSGR